MKKNIKKIKFKPADLNRALLTDVLPYELPLFFSNDEYYSRVTDGTCAKLDPEIYRNFFGCEKYTLPYNYEIIKSDCSARLLSIMHPAVQMRSTNIYKKYSGLIIHLCSRSSFSIRRPVRVAKHYFEKSAGKRFHRASDEVELVGDGFDRQSSIASSFFAYADYNLSYRFFDSRRFQDLEKKFRYFRSLDISKCFYHIYSHTISWAIKDKEFAKRHTNKTAFEVEFDKLMQHANYNETNGIIVGPEISRIFAEIILQRVDLELETELKAKKLQNGHDYQICRYVDDYYVFSNSESVVDEIERRLSLRLAGIKLYFNEGKSVSLLRPFSLKQTLAKVEAARIVDRIFDGLTELVPRSQCYMHEQLDGELDPNLPTSATTASTVDASQHIRFPKYIKFPEGLAASYIRDLKLAVISNGSTFEYVSAYFHAGLIRRLRKLLARIDVKNLTAGRCERLWKFISQIVTIYMFVFSMSPRVRSTYQLSEFVVLVKDVTSCMPADYAEHTKRYIFDEVLTVIHALCVPGRPQTVEIANLLVVLDTLGAEYRVKPPELLKIFRQDLNGGVLANGLERDEPLSYFEIVTLLRYAGNNADFDLVKEALAKNILVFLQGFKGKKYFEFAQKTENVLLVFDCIRCPFLSTSARLAIAKAVIEIHHSHDVTVRAKQLCSTIDTGDWFYRWDGLLNLRTVLQKKELRSAY